MSYLSSTEVPCLVELRMKAAAGVQGDQESPRRFCELHVTLEVLQSNGLDSLGRTLRPEGLNYLSNITRLSSDTVGIVSTSLHFQCFPFLTGPKALS